MLVSLTLPCARGAAAQRTVPLGSPAPFRLDQWTTEHGLPQNSVTALAETPDGYLWVGTFGGLARFDGTSFTLVERRDSAGRHIDRVLSLAVGSDSTLWIGTESGLLRRRGTRYDSYATAQGLPSDEISWLHVDRGGVLWIGTPRGNVRFVNDRFVAFSEVDGKPVGTVASIVEDRRGTLWLETSDGIVLIDGTGAGTRRLPAAAAGQRLLLEDRAGVRWFRRARGVARVAASGDSMRAFGPADSVPRPARMLADPAVEGGYWLITTSDGLFYLLLDGSRPVVRRYPLPDGNLRYRVRAAHVDRGGNVWFGIDAGGLVRVKRNLFTTYTAAEGLSHGVTTAVYEDSRGTVWVGTNCYGVNAIDLQRAIARHLKPPLTGDPEGDPCVFSITESPPGTMWVGTWGGGLTRITAGRLERLRYRDGLSDNVVLALFTARDGTVWVGTNSGGLAAVDRARGRVRVAYDTSDGLAGNSVRSIYQARDGALWIGTLTGLSRLDDGRVTTWKAAQGLSSAHVRAIHEDSDGTLWIGTYGGGLNRFQGGKFTPITRADGLAEDVVSTILEDEHGYFWMSGNRGIARVARSDLSAFADGRRPRVRPVLYGIGDGLINPETNGGFQPAAWKDRQGRMWFPTVRGVAVVDPSLAAVSAGPPPVTIEQVLVDGEAHDSTPVIRAGPGATNLEIHYAGLSLSAPEHITYRYRLEGFDPDWVDAGTRRVAYYPRLAPGDYRFSVSAANRAGIWGTEATLLRAMIAAPFYDTWWFRLLTAAVLIGLVVATVRERERRARARRIRQEEFARALIASQEHERKRLAGELHDQLGQDLLVVKSRALIALQADGLSGPARAQLEQISDVAAQALETVRGMAHHLTPYQLDHLGLTAALRSMTEAIAGATAITVDVSVDDVDSRLPPHAAIHLYRIVQEALNNVVKHSGGKTSLVRVRCGADDISVTISDDGRGFSSAPAQGFGLSEIVERTRILGGRLEIASAPGRGTRLHLVLPTKGAGTPSA